jgi:hypothetical protein
VQWRVKVQQQMSREPNSADTRVRFGDEEPSENGILPTLGKSTLSASALAQPAGGGRPPKPGIESHDRAIAINHAVDGRHAKKSR